jgi:hypothetical protein
MASGAEAIGPGCILTISGLPGRILDSLEPTDIASKIGYNAPGLVG